MHETSLNRTIIDYLSGQEIEDTTFEDLRQALAQMLVEEKQYPKSCLRSKEKIKFQIEGQQLEAKIDIASFDLQERPLLAVLFCFGNVGSFVRQSLAIARLWQPVPFPLTLVTDTKDARLLRTEDGQQLRQGYHSIPFWPELVEMAKASFILDQERREKEERILYAYQGLSGPCCGSSCSS